MTWREVKDLLDHMRETCIAERQEYKERMRAAERKNGELSAALVVILDAGDMYRRGSDAYEEAWRWARRVLRESGT